ncbi:unnamed protein product [Orchesella dallaii]|uniref:Uncharacterized protein n=1 Tax=Orchesella dallaii TaxID=48710 RepID=A0ABP1RZC0_9HEXA
MSVACVKDEVKSEFHLKVIRLAKFWIDGTILKEYVSAKSYMIELIAIHAQRKRKNKCVVSGFRRFLAAMSQFGQLLFSINGKVLVSFKNDRPVLIDVVNPFLNLAQDISPKVVEGLQFQAMETLKVLQQLKKSVNYIKLKDPIGAIFSKKLVK